MSRRPFLTARILLVFYLIAGLLLPLGGLVSASAPVLPEINFSSPAFEAAPQAEASSTKETPPTASVRQNEDYLYLNFPDEGPEAAILADLLSKMAINALFDPFVRPARMSEVVDTLTYSVYTTMMILGSFVFGVGLIILSWVCTLLRRELTVICRKFTIPSEMQPNLSR